MDFMYTETTNKDDDLDVADQQLMDTIKQREQQFYAGLEDGDDDDADDDLARDEKADVNTSD